MVVDVQVEMKWPLSREPGKVQVVRFRVAAAGRDASTYIQSQGAVGSLARCNQDAASMNLLQASKLVTEVLQQQFQVRRLQRFHWQVR
jgi:hypothetical protein